MGNYEGLSAGFQTPLDLWGSRQKRYNKGVRVFFLGVCLGLLSACGSSTEPVPFPVGLDPLEASLAPPPEGPDFPESIVIVQGEEEDYAWAHGRAYVHAPAQEVWKALQVADVVVDRRAVDEWSFEEGIDPEFEGSFRVHNIVHDMVTVEFDVDWRLGRQFDEDDAITLLAARFAKTDGTPFISLLEGSIVGWPMEEGIIELEFVEHVQAAQGGSETIASYLEDLYADLLAWVHDDPLVDYEEEAR